jgi:repressor LexA
MMARSTGGGAHGNGDDMRRKIVRAIERYHHRHNQWPTYREIGEAVGIEAPSHVLYHVGVLVKQGYLTHVPGISRGVALAGSRTVDEQAHEAGVRLLGRIAAGAPLDLFEAGEEEVVDLGRDVLAGAPREEVYALRVVGDSMIEDGILNGDLVLVRWGENALNGRIAVVVERSANGGLGAATLKRIFKEDDQVRLQPANAAYAPQFVASADWDREWMVRGTLLGVYRRYDL